MTASIWPHWHHQLYEPFYFPLSAYEPYTTVLGLRWNLVKRASQGHFIFSLWSACRISTHPTFPSVIPVDDSVICIIGNTGIYTVSQKRPLFIFPITLSKINRFNDFRCVKSWENLTSIACIFATLPVYCSHFTLGNQKSYFQQYYVYILQIIYVISGFFERTGSVWPNISGTRGHPHQPFFLSGN